MQAALDYTSWLTCRAEWSSVEEFLAASRHDDGVHSIRCGELPIDLLLINGAMLTSGKQKVLPIFLSGAVTARRGKPGPFFSGRSIASGMGVAALCVADPSLATDSELELAWYTGSAWQSTQPLLTALLGGLAKRLHVELLLVGGSGGGFAALFYAGRIGDRASALVWNPQTDFLGYYRNAVRTYLRACFPDGEWPDQQALASTKEVLAGRGVSSSIVDEYVSGNLPRRVLYLQNAQDVFHVQNHAGPLLSKLDVKCIEPATYECRTGDALFWFGQWGRGDEPLPKSTLISLLGMMLDVSAKPADIAQWLRKQWVSGAHTFPLSFRHLDAAAKEFVVTAKISGHELHVRSLFPRFPGNHDAPTFAYYVFSGKNRIQTRWYEPSGSATFPILTEQLPTRVVAFALDSFGEKVHCEAAVETVAKTPRLEAVPARTRVLIVGSCVSRDAFALMESSSLSLFKYIARSSLASATQAVVAGGELLASLSNIASPWQRRMVEFDLTRKLPKILTDDDSFDVVLLDLIDERFALSVLNGTVFTVSNEFRCTGYPLASATLLAYDHHERMRLWKEGAARFMALARPERVVLNKAFWATHASDGTQLENQADIQSHNQILARMYRHLEMHYPLRSIRYQRELLVADKGHRWGLSPFHYVSGMYAHMIDELEKLARSLAASTSAQSCQ